MCTLLAIAVLPAAAAAQQARGRQDDQKQRERRVERFRGMDRDGDGVITRAEWRGNDQSFRRQDTNGDGVLSGAETGGLTPGARGAAVDAQAALDRRNAAFSRADTNNDGRLGRDEWRGNLASFNRADSNHDGAVTRVEFLQRPGAGTPGEEQPQTRAYRAGYEKGRLEGRQAGKEDRQVNGGKWDLEGQRELEQADSGYDNSLGPRAEYQAGYRAGFRLGYREGFGPR